MFSVNLNNMKELPYDFNLYDKSVYTTTSDDNENGNDHDHDNEVDIGPVNVLVHKAILIISCKYFKRYFQDFYHYTNGDTKTSAHFPQFTGYDLTILVNLLYNNKLPQIKTYDQYMQVRNIITFFGVDLVEHIPQLTPNHIPTTVLKHILNNNNITDQKELTHLIDRIQYGEFEDSREEADPNYEHKRNWSYYTNM